MSKNADYCRLDALRYCVGKLGTVWTEQEPISNNTNALVAESYLELCQLIYCIHHPHELFGSTHSSSNSAECSSFLRYLFDSRHVRPQRFVEHSPVR